MTRIPPPFRVFKEKNTGILDSVIQGLITLHRGRYDTKNNAHT